MKTMIWTKIMKRKLKKMVLRGPYTTGPNLKKSERGITRDTKLLLEIAWKIQDQLANPGSADSCYTVVMVHRFWHCFFFFWLCRVLVLGPVPVSEFGVFLYLSLFPDALSHQWLVSWSSCCCTSLFLTQLQSLCRSIYTPWFCLLFGILVVVISVFIQLCVYLVFYF